MRMASSGTTPSTSTSRHSTERPPGGGGTAGDFGKGFWSDLRAAPRDCDLRAAPKGTGWRTLRHFTGQQILVHGCPLGSKRQGLRPSSTLPEAGSVHAPPARGRPWSSGDGDHPTLRDRGDRSEPAG